MNSDFSLIGGEEYSQRICGINDAFIENCKDYELIIDSIKCPICLNVLLEPIECNKCQCIICENCFFILQLADKSCVNDFCKEGKYEKANKFTRSILSNLLIKCYACQKGKIRYEDYCEHIKKCDKYLQNPLFKTLANLNSKQDLLVNLNKEYKDLKEKYKKQNTLSDQELRSRYVTNILQTNQKMTFYQTVIDGDLNHFKNLVNGTSSNPPYNIFEEVSAPGFGWTTFHYAMHYAKLNIIKFIIENLRNKNLLSIGFRLKSKDGRCPILCLLKSNALRSDQKRIALKEILSNYQIPLSDEVKKEIKNRKMDDLIEGYKELEID